MQASDIGQRLVQIKRQLPVLNFRSFGRARWTGELFPV